MRQGAGVTGEVASVVSRGEGRMVRASWCHGMTILRGNSMTSTFGNVFKVRRSTTLHRLLFRMRPSQETQLPLLWTTSLD